MRVLRVVCNLTGSRKCQKNRKKTKKSYKGQMMLHFFHSLLFSTLKYDFSQTLPVTGQVSNHPQYTQQTLSYHMQKTVWLYLKSVAREVVLRFWLSKRKATLLNSIRTSNFLFTKFL